MRLLLGCLLLVSCGRTQPLQPRTCALAASVDHLDFGALAPHQQRTETVTLTAVGTASCTLTQLHLLEGSDAAFALTTAPSLPLHLARGGAVEVTVTFAPLEGAPPQRTGILAAESPDDTLEVPLAGQVDACVLTVRPGNVDFGNVALNTTVNGKVTFSNEGTRPCGVDELALSPGTDAHFTLEDPAPRTLPPGGASELVLHFAGTDSAPPHHREGTLTFRSNDARLATGRVPLSAFVNTLCTEAGQYIYTVDNDGRFARFDPRTTSYLDIAPLRCPTSATPYSMNVDQSAVAWVLFSDGNLFKVDTATGACTATSYVPGQQGFTFFGMGSTFDSSTGEDTLFLSTLYDFGQTRLGTLDLTSLEVRFVGTSAVDNAELAGTGDGQLWAFTPANGGVTPTLARLDPHTARVLERYELPTVTSLGGWAVKFFGGAFYLFIGETIWEVERSALDSAQLHPTTPPRLVLTSPGRDIVGAGVSTCAPVQQ